MLTNHNTDLINELYGNKGYRIDVVSVKRMIEKIVLASTEKGQVILDPFCGSGTTGVEACLLYTSDAADE